ncbi:MAG: CHASE2 domain-containing protein, partial [Candidatus Neomarinimicrobiota bacterium]
MLNLQAILKKALVGAGLGLAAALFLWILTTTKGLFLKEVVDGYEFRSYDTRFKAITSDYQEESIDTVVIVDIDQQSINELGNYFRWFHDKHGTLIDFINSGNPKVIMFDILFDPEPDITHDTAFVAATYRSGKVYHAISLSETDTLNFQYAMEAPPDGVHLHVLAPGEGLAEAAMRFFGDPAAAEYLGDINADLLPADGPPQPGQVIRIPTMLDAPGLTLPIPPETAEHFPSGERFDIAFIDL